jgi:hypothetical protein
LAETSLIISSLGISRNPHRNRNSSSDFSFFHCGTFRSLLSSFFGYFSLYLLYLRAKSLANWQRHLKSYLLFGLAAIRIQIGIVVRILAFCLLALFVRFFQVFSDTFPSISFIYWRNRFQIGSDILNHIFSWDKP